MIILTSITVESPGLLFQKSFFFGGENDKFLKLITTGLASVRLKVICSIFPSPSMIPLVVTVTGPYDGCTKTEAEDPALRLQSLVLQYRLQTSCYDINVISIWISALTALLTSGSQIWEWMGVYWGKWQTYRIIHNRADLLIIIRLDWQMLSLSLQKHHNNGIMEYIVYIQFQDRKCSVRTLNTK